jgi:hypothetical protein
MAGDLPAGFIYQPDFMSRKPRRKNFSSGQSNPGFQSFIISGGCTATIPSRSSVVDSEVHPTYISITSWRLPGGIVINGSLLNEVRGALLAYLCS